MKSLREIANDSLSVYCFSPPLYVQRYLFTVKLIGDHGKDALLKVVDIGCADLGLFPYLKKCKGVTEITFIDINYQLLKDSYFKVNPLASDSIYKRNNPLSVTVLCGDAKCFHDPTLNADVVTMVEFIEHVYEDDLPSIVKNVFEFISPNLVIITTPNSDYNKYFLNLSQKKFRHPDHKFEWRQEKFESWCNGIVDNFPDYQVKFSGCGGPRNGSYCTQIGIFNKIKMCNTKHSDQPHTNQGNILKLSDQNRLSSEPCRGCREDSICNVVHKIHYPRDTRTKQHRSKDKILGLFGKLRFWLKDCLNSWDLTGDKVVYVFNEQQIFSKEYPSDDSQELTSESLVQLNSRFSNLKVENCSDSISEDKSLDLTENKKHVKDTFPKSTSPDEGIKLTFTSVYNFDSLVKNYITLLDNKRFYYSEIEETFYFTVNTFCRWANQKIEDILEVKSHLVENEIQIKEVDSHLIIALTFGKEAEDE